MSEREKFEKWLREYEPDQSLTLAAEFPYYASYVTCMVAAAWQAALSTRKPYGFGIVDSEGLHVDYATTDKAANIATKLHFYMRPDDGPYRVVPLFYEEQS